jgi:hypothetical protein
MTQIDWPRWITTLVALYAAFVATAGEVARRRAQQRSLRIDLSTGVPIDESGVGKPALVITTINPGFQSITINSVGIHVSGGNFIVFPKPQSDVAFPHDLAGGKSCMVWTDPVDLAGALSSRGFRGEVKLAGYARDALGKTHMGKPLAFRVEKWLQSA